MTIKKTNNIKESNKTSSLITIADESQMRKHLRYLDQNFTKEPVANLSKFTATVVEVSLENILEAVNFGGCTIIPGYIEGSKADQSVEFLSQDRFKADWPNKDAPFTKDGNTWVATRTKNHLKPGNVLFLDFDVSEDTPDEFRNLTPSELIDKFALVFPEMKQTGYVCSYGSSSGIFDAAGKNITPVTGCHLYMLVKDSEDLTRFKKVLFDRCLLADLYWHKTLKNGEKKIQTIFDISAISWERLCYESTPLLSDGLTRKVPESVLKNGSVLDTSLLLDLTTDEIEQVNKICNKGSLVTSKKTSKKMNIDNMLLKPNTSITYEDGSSSNPQDFYNSGVDKKACFSPFRDDMNPSAFIARHNEKPNIVVVIQTPCFKSTGSLGTGNPERRRRITAAK
jgi:hypothetical protein